MSYLVDSDWVADWLKGRPPAIDLLNRLAPDGLAISLISYGELYEGIYYGQSPRRYEQVFRQFLRPVRVLPLNRAIMRRFAVIRGQLRRQGASSPTPISLSPPPPSSTISCSSRVTAAISSASPISNFMRSSPHDALTYDRTTTTT
jgi:tRNA(fMet)-specific endonuclease VapC